MVKKINNDFNEQLNRLVGKNITIIQEGFVESKYEIQRLEYYIKYDILTINDIDNISYLKINLNEVYKMEYKETQIIFYLDNDIIITLDSKKVDDMST